MFANLKVKNLAVAPLLLALVFSATPVPATAPVLVADIAPVSATLGGASSAMGIGSN